MASSSISNRGGAPLRLQAGGGFGPSARTCSRIPSCSHLAMRGAVWNHEVGKPLGLARRRAPSMNAKPRWNSRNRMKVSRGLKQTGSFARPSGILELPNASSKPAPTKHAAWCRYRPRTCHTANQAASLIPTYEPTAANDRWGTEQDRSAAGVRARAPRSVKPGESAQLLQIRAFAAAFGVGIRERPAIRCSRRPPLKSSRARCSSGLGCHRSWLRNRTECDGR